MIRLKGLDGRDHFKTVSISLKKECCIKIYSKLAGVKILRKKLMKF